MSESEVTAHDVQSAVEDVSTNDIEFMGESFRLPDKLGIMPLLIFANAAKSGLDSDDMEGAAALYSMVKDSIHPDDWPRFERLSITSKADADDLMAVVSQVIEKMAARPTAAPSGSSTRGRNTSKKLKGRSASVATAPPGADKLLEVGELI